MNLKGISLVIGLLFLAGCATSGTDLHIVQEGYHETGMGYRVTNVANANMFEPTFQYTVLEKCTIDLLIETVTYEIEDEDTLLTETVTETIEHKVPRNCEPVRVDHVSSPGFLPGMVGSALNAAGVAYAGYAIGDGIKGATPDTTNISQSADNSASGNAKQYQGQGQDQGQGQGQGQSSYNSNRNSNYNSNRNYNSNKNYNSNRNRNSNRQSQSGSIRNYNSNRQGQAQGQIGIVAD